MPTAQGAAMNPLDNLMLDGSYKNSKKPFNEVNQHYTSHKAILPDFGTMQPQNYA